MRHPSRPRTAAIAIVMAATLAALSGSPASASPVQAPAPHRVRITIGSSAWQLFKATNASRGRFGLPELVLNRQMSQVAIRHSEAMVQAGELFHTADVDTYLQGIDWHVWGENVGFTPGDVASMEDAFMQSPPHRANILDRSFRHVAIGVVRHDGYLWVTVFFYA